MAPLAKRRIGDGTADYGTDTHATDASLLSEIELDGDKERQEQQKVAKFRRWFSDSFGAAEDWRRRAAESYRFVAGKQWSDEDLKFMEDRSRPALVINKIIGPIQFLEGVQRQQRREPALLPREEGDIRAAELMGALLKAMGKNSREAQIDSEVFRDKIVAGLGCWAPRVDFERSPEGDVVWRRVHPLALFFDPNWIDQGFGAAQYAIEATWYDLEQAMDEYPDHAEHIRRRFGEWINGTAVTSGNQSPSGVEGEQAGDSLSSLRTWWDPETQRLRCLEVWYIRRQVVEVAIHRDGSQVTSDPATVKRLKRAAEMMPEIAEEVTFARRPVRRAYLAKLLDDILLSDDDSPFDQPVLPFFPTVAYLYGGELVSVVDVMKDPQREKNVRRSRIIEAVRRMPTSGFFNKENTGAKTEDLENFASGDGVVINYKQDRPDQIQPPDLPQTLVYLEQRADAEIQSVPNINAELQGQGTQRTVSGRAIEARQRGGLTNQEPMLESFQHDKIDATKFVVKLIQQFVPREKALRILGSVANRAADAAGIPMLGEQAAQMIREASLMEIDEMLGEAMLSEYDLEYTDVPWTPGEKWRRWEMLSSLVEQFGEWLPPEVIAEAARDAGVLTESQASRVVAWIEQKLAMMGAPPGGGPPAPGAPPDGPPVG